VEFKAAEDESNQKFVDECCQLDDVELRAIVKRSVLHIVKPMCNWLKAHLGPDLLDLVEDDGIAARTEEEAQVMMFRVSDEYRAARRLALNQEVNSDDAAQDVSDDDEEADEHDPQDDFYPDPMSAEEEDRRYREQENRRDREAQY
jgi:hypothetical protein